MSQGALLKMSEVEKKPYQVLARKYRPLKFEDLKGQDLLVRVLINGLKSGRLPHAFILTGIRGVGKTTTARILARALNCTGRNIKDSVEPCGKCDACISIIQDRFIDVIEMDAASKTGIDDIREVVDASKYKPVSGNFKIYIIDEVHMLSKSAFNGLLKTLEEPPEHVKFIFATTEIKKIPKTVLSRCMRFDLSRVDLKTLKLHFQSIAEKENFELEDRASLLIAKAADGSVRDGLSILDQSLTMSDGKITSKLIEDMLGIGDKKQIFSLWESCTKGKAEEALLIAEKMYSNGNEPLSIIKDLLELTHTLTILKLNPDQINFIGISEVDIPIYQETKEKLTFPTLTRLWQIYLKGLEEINSAPVPYQALQMLLVRSSYASTLPTPDEIIGGSSSSSSNVKPISSKSVDSKNVSSISETDKSFSNNISSISESCKSKYINILSFEDIIKISQEKKEALLQTYLHQDVRVVSFDKGKISLNIPKSVPEDFTRRLSVKLKDWTGEDWIVESSSQKGSDSLKIKEENDRQILINELSKNPLVQKVMEDFPGSKINDVKQTIH